MRRFFALLIISLASLGPVICSVKAETVQVQAGEHADYTRLILHIPAQSDWSLVRDGASARLELAGADVEFDLTQTFSRIPRTRLRDIRPSEAGVTLYLACDCEVQAREDIPQFLIIDIIGTRNEAVYAPRTAPRPPERPRSLMQTPLQTIPDPRRAGQMLARALRGDIDKSDPGAAPIGAQDTPALSRLLAMRAAISDDTPSHSQITREISKLLASSVSSGLLQPASDFLPPASQPPAPNSDVAFADAHLAIVTGDQTKKTAHAQVMPTCPDNTFFDPSAWNIRSDRDGPSFQWQDLFDALDQLDERQVLELTREFLYFGFGAEARLALSLLAEPPEHTQILTAISYLVDISALPPKYDLEVLRGCKPMGSLWTFLSQSDDAHTTDFPADHLVQALQKLPPRLRLHLGPIVIQRLAGAGLSEQARVIHAALDRIATNDTSALTLARVSLDLQNATPDEARFLERTLSPDSSDDDLIFLLSRRVAQEEAVEPTILDAATTRLFALRGSEIGRELASLVIKAKAQAEDFQGALDILDGRDAALDSASSQTLRAYILANMVTGADDAEFVTLIFAQRPWTLTYLPEPLVQDISARLRRLGFDLQAQLLDDALQVMPSRFRATDQPLRDTPVEPRVSQARTAGTAPGAPTETAMYQDDIARARSAQSLRRSQEDRASRFSDAPSSADMTPTEMQVPPQRPPELTQQDSESRVGAVVGSPESSPPDLSAQEEPGLLSQSRDALAHSADLRARLQSLLEPAGTQ